MPKSSPLTDQQFAAMNDAVLSSELGRQFLAEYVRRNSSISANEIHLSLARIEKSMVTHDVAGPTDILRRELQEMSASIMQTRQEIAAIKPEDAGNNRIMAATGELDAIVTATERATSEILGSAEHIQDINEKLREAGADDALCDSIDEHATEIFMACSFQDITGQRTTKVVNVLHYLEHRVNTMIEIWGVEGIEPSEALKDPTDDRPDAHLLNGPQAEGEGVEQDEVDQIMKAMMGDTQDQAVNE